MLMFSQSTLSKDKGSLVEMCLRTCPAQKRFVPHFSIFPSLNVIVLQGLQC